MAYIKQFETIITYNKIRPRIPTTKFGKILYRTLTMIWVSMRQDTRSHQQQAICRQENLCPMDPHCNINEKRFGTESQAFQSQIAKIDVI